MRKLTDHKINEANEALTISVMDEPGAGGASHHYVIDGYTPPSGIPLGTSTLIAFQNRPIQEAGVNGISNESLLAIVIDRLRGFQFQRNKDGSFDEAKRWLDACKENACALTHIEEALLWLHSRSRKRMARGVEGTMKP